ncbi:MAG TPA: PEP-CTERM sorting domain-containing protein [Chromatiales bacterium]|nr:PEP-CTERM sorting domain-containing protein [Chromatiales bacterium]
MGKQNIKLMGVVAAAAFLLAPVANAQLSLRLDDGTATATVTDTSDSGMVNFSGSLGAWTANVTSGFGAPLLGSDWMDEFDLNSVNVSGGSGSMTIMLTQTNLTRTNAPWMAGFGGTTDGSVSFQSWVDAGNNAFAQNTLVSDSGVQNGGQSCNGCFGGGDSGGLGGFSLSGPYSWTIVATITHSDAFKVTSFDYNVKIPEPSSLALLGLGLIGAGIASRRKAKKTA